MKFHLILFTGLLMCSLNLNANVFNFDCKQLEQMSEQEAEKLFINELSSFIETHVDTEQEYSYRWKGNLDAFNDIWTDLKLNKNTQVQINDVEACQTSFINFENFFSIFTAELNRGLKDQ